MDNLKRLAELGESIIIRIPVIPGFNHTDKEIKSMIDFAAILKGVSEIHFIPYHTLGTEKYTMLGMKYGFEAKKAVDPVELTTYIKYANVKGFKTRIGG
jgi:pyruvate formate lyase activating enzyme